MRAASDQAGKMRHIDQIERADFVSDLAHTREIDDAWVRAAATDDHLGALLFGELLQIVVIDSLSFLGHTVGNDAVSLSRKVEMVPVRKMATMRQVQAENGVSRLQHGRVSFHVGLRSGVRLNVGVFSPKKLFGAIARQVL